MDRRSTHKVIYKKVDIQVLKVLWEQNRSPDDISASPEDPLGVVNITSTCYDEAAQRRNAEAAYQKAATPRQIKKNGRPAPKDQFIANFIRRGAARNAKSMLICDSYELLPDSRQCRVTFEVIFPGSDDMFKLAFLFDATPSIKDGLKIVPENTSVENYESMVKKYLKGEEQVGIMLRHMANVICPRLHKLFGPGDFPLPG